MSRLFVAIPLLGEAISELTRIQPPPVPGLRIVRPDQLHVTLHFIGEGDIEEIRNALTVVAETSFDMTISGVGKFPPRGKASVLWAGIVMSVELQRLHAAVGTALTATGFTPETRPYAPHITLARCGHSVAFDVVEEFLAHHQGFQIPPVRVSEFRLYSSTTAHDGPEYRCEQSYPLQAANE